MDDFSGWNLKNTIRINKIEPFKHEIIGFDIKQITPDISLQDLCDGIQKKLEESLKSLNIDCSDEVWKEIYSFSLGDEDDVQSQADAYLRGLDKDK